MNSWNRELWKCSQMAEVWLCHIFPAGIRAHGVATQIIFFWLQMMLSVCQVWLAQRDRASVFSQWGQSINTNWLHDWIPQAPKLHRSITAPPPRRLRPTHSQLRQPGMKNSGELVMALGVGLRKGVSFSLGGKEGRYCCNTWTWLQLLMQHRPDTTITGHFSVLGSCRGHCLLRIVYYINAMPIFVATDT